MHVVSRYSFRLHFEWRGLSVPGIGTLETLQVAEKMSSAGFRVEDLTQESSAGFAALW